MDMEFEAGDTVLADNGETLCILQSYIGGHAHLLRVADGVPITRQLSECKRVTSSNILTLHQIGQPVRYLDPGQA